MKKIQLGGHQKRSKIKAWTLVSDELFDFLNQWNWSAFRDSHTKSYYAARREYLGGGKKNAKFHKISMHRLIMYAPKGMQVDHINGNTLDNRKENLRICTNAENQHNSNKPKNNLSGFKGVTWHKNIKIWTASICKDYKKIHLGIFKTKTQAARAYDQAALKYFGEFAKTNFIYG